MGATRTPSRAIVALHNNTTHIVVRWNDNMRQYEPIVLEGLTQHTECNFRVLADMVEMGIMPWLQSILPGRDDLRLSSLIDAASPIIVAYSSLHDEHMIALGELANANDTIAEGGRVIPPPIAFVLRREINRGQTFAGWFINDRALWIDDPSLSVE